MVCIVCAFKIAKISRLNNCQLILDLSGYECKNLNYPTIKLVTELYLYNTFNSEGAQ